MAEIATVEFGDCYEGPRLVRVRAPNVGPSTSDGTNSYVLVREGTAVIVDPGPLDEVHLADIGKVVGGRKVAAILLTHRHRDHTDSVLTARERWSAPVLAFGRAPVPVLDFAGQLTEILPDRILVDAEVVTTDCGTITAIHTPGHAADHLCFSVTELQIILTGDHVMGWSTTSVAPPHGSVHDYLNSLRRLKNRTEHTFYPGHGESIIDTDLRLDELGSRRRARMDQIAAVICGGENTFERLMKRFYNRIKPDLVPVATRTLESYLIGLAREGSITIERDAQGKIISLTSKAPL